MLDEKDNEVEEDDEEREEEAEDGFVELLTAFLVKLRPDFRPEVWLSTFRSG